MSIRAHFQRGQGAQDGFLRHPPIGEDSMRFYTHQHRYTCGIDLHARSLYVCILDDTGQTLARKKY